MNASNPPRTSAELWEQDLELTMREEFQRSQRRILAKIEQENEEIEAKEVPLKKEKP